MAKLYAKTKKHINRLGFGAWQLGNTDFWGHMAIEDGIQLVKEAVKLGINFFDTAPGYAYGLSESIIGEAVKDIRDKVTINTKLGHTASGETDFSVFSLREQIYESLERLQTDYVDSVLLHNPSMDILEGKTLHFQELEKIKEEGLIKAFGVSIDTYDELKAVLSHGRVDVIEILFNIFFQDAMPLFKEAKDKGISLIAKVPLDSGWLTGKYDEHASFEGIRSRWDDETIERRANLVKKIQSLTHDQDLTKYALAFILSFEEITAVIPGIKDIKQLTYHVKHKNFELTPALKEAFVKLYQEHIKDEPLSW